MAAVDVAMPMLDLTDDDFDTLFNTNTGGIWHCLKHEIAAMVQTGGGVIVNQTSLGAMRTQMLQAWIDMAGAAGVDVPVDGGTIQLNRGMPSATGAAPPTPGDEFLSK